MFATAEQRETVARAAAEGRDPLGLQHDRTGRCVVRRRQHRNVHPPRRRRVRHLGRKWWTTGILSSDCKLVVVMGLSDPEAERHERHTMLLVPRDSPGLEVRRGLSIMGYWDETHGGHAEVVFDDVRVGQDAVLGEQGKGFALAQARLGPGRIHHCMRLVGMAERAFELMCQRADERIAFGKPLAKQGVVIDRIAEARLRIDQLRLLVLRAAWLIDQGGAKNARTEISAIKIAAPTTAQWVIDAAIQTHGAGGLTADFPLAMLWAQARGLRFADGPEEVHSMVLARNELLDAGRPREPPELAHIEVEATDEGVAVATLARPEKLNALTFEMFDEIRRLALGSMATTRSAPSS